MRTFKSWLKKKLGIRPTFGTHTPNIPHRKVSVPTIERRIAAARDIQAKDPWIGN